MSGILKRITKTNRHLLNVILIIFIIPTQIMGQIILSQTNERFETYVNDIVKRNLGKQLEFIFFASDSGKGEKTEKIKVDWEKENIIVISQASTDYGSSLDRVSVNKYRYVDGYFSDLEKEKGDYTEVTRTDNKNLVFKAYGDGKLIVENKITLDNNKETIFSDHTNYYVAAGAKPVRTLTAYSTKIINEFTKVITQESNDITDGIKKLNHKIETTEISSFNNRTNVKTLTCKTKAVLGRNAQPDYEFQIFLKLDPTGRLIKVGYPGENSMTIHYK